MKNTAQYRSVVLETGKIRREQTFTTDWPPPEPVRAEVIPFAIQSVRQERLFAVDWAT